MKLYCSPNPSILRGVGLSPRALPSYVARKRFTQRDLARLLGREHGLVSRIETCERRVELVELIQILTAIGCDVEFEIGRLVADLLKITTSDELDSPKAGRGKAGGR